MLEVGVIDYGLGNLASVAGAIEKVGHKAIVTSDANILHSMDKLVLPGVGAFGDGMEKLRELELIDPLSEMVCEGGMAILGICLGSQLLTYRSDEFGSHEGFGWVPAQVRLFKPSDSSLRVPHVGWNDLFIERESVLFRGLSTTPLFYYVHSYYIEPIERNIILGECDYGVRFVSAFQHHNIYGTQFHPEKSQLDGLKLIKNFIELT